MKKIIFTLIGSISFCGTVNADCTDVIKLSKTTSSTVQNKSSIDSAASSFCSEYKKGTSTTKSENYGISYKFLAASMGKNSASETEIASSFCSSDTSSSSRQDAYQQYVESISDKAYAAYTSCERMKSASVTFTINSLLKKSTMISVGNSASMNYTATLSYDTSEGTICAWYNPGVKPDTIQLNQGYSTTLKCTRSSTDEESAITITELSSGNANSLTIPWAAMDKDGLPVDHLRRLNQTVETATTELDTATKNLSGAVVSFNLSTCPTGWKDYQPAYGRFIRGIDKSGNKIDVDSTRAPGTLQNEDLKKHTHALTLVGRSGNKAFIDRPPAWGYDDAVGKPSTATTNETGGEETRPKNVALLYCEKS
jgi:hypothetical protein